MDIDKLVALCVRCGKMVDALDPIRVKWRNRRKPSGTVEAIKGKCPHCNLNVYKIVG